jgi:hypothetical protein
MSSLDRRLGYRIPLDAMFTLVARERPLRAMAADLSDAGLGLHAVAGVAPASGAVVGVELDIPALGDSIWARATVCHYRPGEIATGIGLRFTAMARFHARLLRDFVVESRRSHLGGLLAKIRRTPALTA